MAAAHDHPHRNANITPYLLFTCIICATGGFVYGYDLVVAGGISIMNDFLHKFYPNVLENKLNAKEDNYCKYNNQVFQLFSSCLYMSALMATLVASIVSRKQGRKVSLLIAGLLFLAGTALGTSADDLGMLITGRVLLGSGLGFANQAAPMYLSEIAPPSIRGGLGLLFGINIAIGIFSGNIVNYFASTIHPWGWRLSLGLVGLPAILLTVFSLMLGETPTSLLERGHNEQAKAVLRRIRNSEDVDAEFMDLIEASQRAQLQFQNPFRSLLTRRNRPQLVLGLAIPFFQQAAGNDVILFYGAFLFKTAGFQDRVALYSAAILGTISLAVCFSAALLVDRAGRRVLLLTGSAVMATCMVVVGVVFATGSEGDGNQQLSRSAGQVQVTMLCLFVAAFGSTWGPLAWLLPSEIYPQELRSAGQSISVFVNMLFKFIIAQTFLTMLCAFKYGAFLFFGGWGAVMGAFTYLLIPETSGVRMDKMAELVWCNHWFWKRFVDQPQPQPQPQANDSSKTTSV